MKRLLSSAIALALLCLVAPAQGQTKPTETKPKPTVHCAKPQRGGAGLTVLMKAKIASAVGVMTLRELVTMAKPPCIRSASRAAPNDPNVTITFLYASDDPALTDRVYVVTVDHGIVIDVKTEFLHLNRN